MLLSEDYDLEMLRRFINLFPSSPLSRTITGYFQCADIPLKNENEEDSEKEEPNVDYDAAFQLALVNRSIFAEYHSSLNLIHL